MSSRMFSELQSFPRERNPESSARFAETLERISGGLEIADLRIRAGQTQQELAERIGTTQSGVSRLERQRDFLVSTLSEYVEATGGRIRLLAEYPDGIYELGVTAMRSERFRDEPRSFDVVWRDPWTHQLLRVGELTFTGARFRFKYLTEAQLHPSFEPFPEFSHLDRTYESDELFPAFAKRVATSATGGPEALITLLGLDGDSATPLELLERSWAQSPHDTIQVVPRPRRTSAGAEELPFLVSGVSHAHEADAEDSPGAVTRRIQALKAGQLLQCHDEPENAFNPRAIVLKADARRLGWIPDYLLDYVHKRRNEGHTVSVAVLQANGPDVPWHLRLLCSLSVSPAHWSSESA